MSNTVPNSVPEINYWISDQYCYRVNYVSPFLRPHTKPTRYSDTEIYTLATQMQNWLLQNVINQCAFSPTMFDIRLQTDQGLQYIPQAVYFTQAEDAAAFMLRWNIDCSHLQRRWEPAV